MNILFLDIDGVLNDHKPMENGYCTIQYDKVQRLNRILSECPDVQIVIHSAWRYLVLLGQMNLQGFEHMLVAFGVNCRGRVHSLTPLDEEPDRCRKTNILNHAEGIEGLSRFVVVDDLELDMPELIRINGILGMTDADADLVIERFAKSKGWEG